MPLPGFSVSVLRQQTFARRNQPVTMSGRVTAFGFGVPAFVRVFLEGPAHNPEVQTFDTFAAPLTGDYAIPVLAAKDGQYVVYTQAFPPVGIPLPGAPEPLFLGPPLAESPRPPLAIGQPVDGELELEMEPGRFQRITPPPPTPVEVITPITIGGPVIRIGAPPTAPPPAAPPPAAPPPAAPPPAPPPPAAPPPAPPPPAPPPTEAIPLPEEPALPGVADISATFSPAEVTIGEVATGTLNWLPQDTQAFTFGVRVDLVDSTGGVVMNILRANPTATMGVRQATPLSVDTTGLPEGWYGVEVTFTDLATGAEILRRILANVLRLVPPPPPPPPQPPSPAPPAAQFSFSPTSGSLPLTVTFNDLSLGVRDSYLWDFGDGSISTEINPLHVYQNQGTYSVTLTVTGPGGSNSFTHPAQISVVAVGLVTVFLGIRNVPPPYTEWMVRWTDAADDSVLTDPNLWLPLSRLHSLARQVSTTGFMEVGVRDITLWPPTVVWAPKIGPISVFDQAIITYDFTAEVVTIA